jgi:hypothetical protein
VQRQGTCLLVAQLQQLLCTSSWHLCRQPAAAAAAAGITQRQRRNAGGIIISNYSNPCGKAWEALVDASQSWTRPKQGIGLAGGSSCRWQCFRCTG